MRDHRRPELIKLDEQIARDVAEFMKAKQAQEVDAGVVTEKPHSFNKAGAILRKQKWKESGK